mgnify:CR=1 FL=1
MKIVTSTPSKFKLGAWLIRIYQKTTFSHVAIISDNLVFQASHGMVNCTHIDVFNQNNTILDTFNVNPEILDMEYVYKQLGKPYSYFQVLRIALKFLTGIKISRENGDSQFICSEFVGKALKLDWVNDSTTPKEIAIYLKKHNNSNNI